ncbi:hypothetical protein CEXT_334361 [Caerostris extrusa]|uniref:Uncharacterized protein n=1 Tax=Caerostris extrusa TaxID=172846 RepID=A0AAV4QCB8_CAEEX|nr:hypothetical protein CEXT_334361 [Caerostris extrusa]
MPKIPESAYSTPKPLNPNNIIRPQVNATYSQVTPNFSYANVLSSNITPPQTNPTPTINPNLIQQAPFNPDELHKTLYILKEIVNLFTSTSSIDSVFNQLSQAKAPEDKFFVLLNGLAKSTSSKNHRAHYMLLECMWTK